MRLLQLIIRDLLRDSMRQSIRVGLGIFAMGAGLATTVYVLAAPAAPTAAPVKTDAPAERKPVVIPPGYEKVTIAGHTALCEPNDVTWVKQALADVKPAQK